MATTIQADLTAAGVTTLTLAMANSHAASIDAALGTTSTLTGGLVSDAAASSTVSVSSTPTIAELLRDADMNTQLALLDTFATSLVVEGSITSVLELLASLPNEPGRGLAWVVNAVNGGTTRYEGYAFNSFATLGTQYYGCRSDGVYLLSGDTDNGEAIRASVSFGRQNLNSRMLKRLITTYVEAASDATLMLKITTSDGEYTYEARDADADLMLQRIDVGRGLKGSNFTFELFNNEGCHFVLAGFEAQGAEVQHRRI